MPPRPLVVDTTHSPYARLRPVPTNAVHLTDAFWQPCRVQNRTVTLLSQYAQLEESGCLENFRRVAGRSDAPFVGPVFADSDLYKWLEAAASALPEEPSANSILRTHIDEAITLIEGAQRADGYLNTFFAVDKQSERWRNLRDEHEMYCAGHFLQAAVAATRTCGSERLLRVACGVADNLCETFGLAGTGKTFGVDGHPEIEMAMVEMYRLTGNVRYLHQAQFFLDARGRVPTALIKRGDDKQAGGAYHQDHVPYRALTEVTGHAVRMLYLACGAADLYLETGEDTLLRAMECQMENMTARRMSVSGGLGAHWEGEAFGPDYDLPNSRAYNETCAAIASVMWCHRLLLATGDCRYADLMEWTLLNAVLPGLSLDGEHYFYQNPLADDGRHRRKGWFGCACCPPNVARLLAQLPGYVCSVSADAVWVHLYAAGTAHLTLDDGRTVDITTETNYPWSGDITLTVDTTGPLTLYLRIPDWCGEDAATLSVNSEPEDAALTPGTYAALTRTWKPGDRVTLHLPMPVRALQAHPYVDSTNGRIALARGPLLYCLEDTDMPGYDVRDLRIPDAAQFTATFQPDLLGGVVALTAHGESDPAIAEWGNTLYQTVSPGDAEPRTPTAVPIRAIPYFAWANRAPGHMQVWNRVIE